jgi:MSHA biogenesis protein MshP
MTAALCLRRRMTGAGPVRKVRGFALFAAIAILVILAGLGAFIVSVTGLQSQSTGLDVLGTRALLAARAGIEWNMFLIQNPEDAIQAGGPITAPYTCPAAATNLNFGGVLANFTVTVSCTPATPPTPPNPTATEAGNAVRVYEIFATACNFPDGGGACPNNAAANPSYVERQIRVLTETCRPPSGASC